tara:strand:+ start:1654 stop:2097 length:444 start_codon:yes stop_codon:yes gene_type:complete
MINSSDFIKRLQIIIDFYQLSAATLADKIDVQRSGISHLLSGRNKPSLEFVLKLIKQFPEVNLYWLLNGVGNFPATLSDTIAPKIQEPIISKHFKESSPINKEKANEITNPINEDIVRSIQNKNQSDIESIIICYKNGNFKAYKNID